MREGHIRERTQLRARLRERLRGLASYHVTPPKLPARSAHVVCGSERLPNNRKQKTRTRSPAVAITLWMPMNARSDAGQLSARVFLSVRRGVERERSESRAGSIAIISTV